MLIERRKCRNARIFVDVAFGVRNLLYLQYSKGYITKKCNEGTNEYSSIQEINYNRMLERATLHVFLLFPHEGITIYLATTRFSFLRLTYTDVTCQSRLI